MHGVTMPMSKRKEPEGEACHCRYCRDCVPQTFEETGDRAAMIRIDEIERRLERLNRVAAIHWDKLEHANDLEDEQDLKVISIERKTGT